MVAPLTKITDLLQIVRIFRLGLHLFLQRTWKSKRIWNKCQNVLQREGTEKVDHYGKNSSSHLTAR